MPCRADAARPMPKKEKASEGAIVVAEQDGKLSKKDAKVKRRPSPIRLSGLEIHVPCRLAPRTPLTPIASPCRRSRTAR